LTIAQVVDVVGLKDQGSGLGNGEGLRRSTPVVIGHHHGVKSCDEGIDKGSGLSIGPGIGIRGRTSKSGCGSGTGSPVMAAHGGKLQGG